MPPIIISKNLVLTHLTVIAKAVVL